MPSYSTSETLAKIALAVDFYNPCMQAIQCHERDVLQRLEELDKETKDLRRELSESTTARNQLASRVEELQAECLSLHSQVADYEVNKALYVHHIQGSVVL